MKKKIIFILIVIALTLLGFILFTVWENHQNKILEQNKIRYEEIRSDIDKELERYLSITEPYCQKGTGRRITHRTLVENGGFDKEKLLDVDKKSYCKVYVKVECIEAGDYFNDIPGKLEWNIYLSCKNYKEKGYQNWDDGFAPKE